jgi:hypothetical protein
VLGPARIAASIAAVAALALAALGCGSGPSDEPARVRETMNSFKDSVESGDTATICTKLLARRLVANLTALGLPCDVALQSFKSVKRPKLKVLRIKVRGKEAFATVRTNAVGQRPSEDTVHLIREGSDWRIDDLARDVAGPPSPANPQPSANSD